MADEQVSRAKAVALPALPGGAADPRTVISKRPVPAPDSTPALGNSIQELGRSLEGKPLGHFQLEAFIGGGGMGAVFRATDTKLGRIVAVKVLSKDRTDEDTIRRFQNEAQSAARLDHPNIARVYYVGEDQGWNYIVFEFIEGTNIRDLVVQRGPLPLDEAVPYILQVAEALDHASQRDVVHRDIKPSNVLVMPDGRVKLVDMGLARLHQVEASNADLTATGVTLGTFDYISPEQARDPRSADVRSDLYSLGCTFFYMLTGQPPFPGGTVLQKLLSHSSDPPPDVRTFRPDLGEEVSTVVSRLLAKLPAQRYQSPAELIEALVLLASELGMKDVTPVTQVWVRPPSKTAMFERQLPWAIPIALLLLTAVILLFVWPAAPDYDASRMQPVYLAQVTRTKSSAGETTAGPDEAATANERGTSRTAAGGAMAGGSADESTDDGSDEPADVMPPAKPVAGFAGAATGRPATSAAGAPAGLSEPRNGQNSKGADAANSGSADPVANVGNVPGPVAPAPIRRVLVTTDQLDSTDGGVQAVATFHDALEAARHQATVETIELHWNGERVENDCDVNLAGRRLTVRSAAGFQPILAFRPTSGETNLDRRMFRVTQSNLQWDGVELLFELPAEPYEDWALFALDRSSSLELADCVVTVRNVGRDGQSVNRVACVDWIRSTAAEMMAGERSARPSPPPLVALRNTIVRGQASLIRTNDSVPFRMTWHQGLFTSTEQLVEARGAREQPAVTDGLQIELHHVTLSLGNALCSMQMDAEHRYPWMLVCRMIDCILLRSTAPAVDSSRPLTLVEQQFQTPAEPIRKRPFLSGSGNYYPSDTVLFRVDAPGFDGESIEYALVDRDRARDEKWYDEQPTLGMVMWEKLPAGLSVERQTKADFVLDATPQNPARAAGFDPSVLPETDRSITEKDSDKPTGPPRSDRP